MGILLAETFCLYRKLYPIGLHRSVWNNSTIGDRRKVFLWSKGELSSDSIGSSFLELVS